MRTGRGEDSVYVLLQHMKNHVWRELWPAMPADVRGSTGGLVTSTRKPSTCQPVDGRAKDAEAGDGGDEGDLHARLALVLQVPHDHQLVARAVDHRVQRREVALLEVSIHAAVAEKHAVTEEVRAVRARDERVVGAQDARLVCVFGLKECARRAVAAVAHRVLRILLGDAPQVGERLWRERRLLKRAGLPQNGRDDRPSRSRRLHHQGHD